MPMMRAHRRLTEAPQPILYRTLEQASDLSLALLVRTRGETPDLAAQLGREIAAIDPDRRFTPCGQSIRSSRGPWRSGSCSCACSLRSAA